MKEILKDKKKLYALLVILIDFALLCSIIYFKLKGNDLAVSLSVIGTCLVFIFTKFSKHENYKLFLIPLFVLLLFPNNNVYALELKPEEIITYLDNYLVLNDEANFVSSNYEHVILFKDTSGYQAIYYDESQFQDYYNWDENFYYFGLYVGSFCFSFDINNSIISVIDYALSKGNATVFPLRRDGNIVPFEIIYSTRDIKFERGTTVDGWPSIQSVTIYSVEDNEVTNNFGYDLGNVEGYTYITIPPRSQFVLYPKILQPFDFYLFYTGSLDIDILDTLGSNISSSNHIDAISSSVFTYKKVSYLLEDAENKRGIYLSNFNSSDTAVVVGYDPNLFELLTFQNGTATSADKTITFNNTYDLIKNHNNIVDDASGMLGELNFENLTNNVSNIIKSFTSTISVIGVIFYTFLNAMPSFVSEGLNILFVVAVGWTIIKIVRG